MTQAAGPPLFIVGCGRSGSTLLRLMLDAGPDIAIPGESHFIPRLFERFGGRADPDAVASALMATPHFVHWKIDEGAVWECVRAVDRPAFADVIEAAYLANAHEHGKKRWGDKTPIYVRSIPLLAGLWPDARFVHLIRDGRDVALSYLSLHWGPSTIWEAARKWQRDVSAGMRDGRPLGASRYLEVRYESLVDDPERELRRICEFAELSFAPEMLDASKREGHETLAPDEGRPFHARSERKVETGARDWRTQMSEHDVRAIEAIAGDLLSELGYERRYPSTALVDRVNAAVRVGTLDVRAVGSRAKRVVARRIGR
jgi:Sulfotransferase family